MNMDLDLFERLRWAISNCDAIPEWKEKTRKLLDKFNEKEAISVRLGFGGRGFPLDIDCEKKEDETRLKRRLSRLWKTKEIQEIAGDLVNIRIIEEEQ